MTEQRITSRKNPLLQQVKKLLSSRKAREEAGLFAADGELIIPMNKRCESLNAAVAAAIVMWQMKQ